MTARGYPIWKGVDRNGGTHVGGGIPGADSISAFVQHRYEKGWRSLTVTRDGEEVGGIDRRTDNGRRVWWAVSSS